MIIAVDFDGTIVSHRYPAIGKEKPFAFETLRQLAADGHKLILWTVREGDLLKEAVEFCQQRGVDFYAVNSNNPQSGWEDAPSTRKIDADIFIDDCNLGGLPDWPEIYEIVSGKRADLTPRGRKKKKRGFFGRIKDRCRSSREKFNR